MSKNPWSFKIDYDKAIAEDERTIAELEGIQKAMAAMLTDEERGWMAKGIYYTTFSFLVATVRMFPERLAAALEAAGIAEEKHLAYMIVHNDTDFGSAGGRRGC